MGIEQSPPETEIDRFVLRFKGTVVDPLAPRELKGHNEAVLADLRVASQTIEMLNMVLGEATSTLERVIAERDLLRADLDRLRAPKPREFRQGRG